MKNSKKLQMLPLVFLIVWLPACGPEIPTGSCSASFIWQPAGAAGQLRGELSGLLESVSLSVLAGQNVLGSQSCPYEDYRCVVSDVPAGKGRTLTVEAFGAGNELLYRGAAGSVEIKKDQLVEVPVAMTPAYSQDIYPPAAIADLRAMANGVDVLLEWTSVGDDLRAGRASGYQVKYANAAITEANFADANEVVMTPPKPSGQAEQLSVIGLPAGGTYYFAIKVSDDAGNLSPLSNVVEATTSN